MRNEPLMVELFAGSFGWSAGWLARGGRAVGFDIEHCDHHGPVPQNAELVLQDVRTINGAQLEDASIICCSPPCTEFSYRAMPWKRAKALGPPVLGIDLFWQCWRIQHEACEAAGRYIPMVVENVKGAQPWVGRAKWHFGSYYLWADVPALMPPACALKVPGFNFHQHEKNGKGGSFQSAAVKVSGLNWSGSDKPGYIARAFNDTAVKNNGGSWFGVAHNTTSGKLRNPVNGTKQEGLNGPAWFDSGAAQFSSRSNARKAASAAIARIPYALSAHIAQVYWPGKLASTKSENERLAIDSAGW